MSKKLLITGISILILAIVIVVAIAVYNHYIIAHSKLPRPPDSTIENRTKTIQGNMIYQTKIDGDEWFMDPNELNKDKRFDANANLTRNRDGSWSVDSKEHTRLDVWTKGSGDFRQEGAMDTYNHSIIEARGF